jgi:serine/arginine repetitive matrix protein 2
MLVVKKKKSRAALESIKWALGDRTNHGKDKDKGSSDEKPKKEEKDGESSKWKWTLGRSRKDSKEKEKEKPGKRCMRLVSLLVRRPD